MADDTGIAPTRVKIFGRTYHLRSDGNTESLSQLAGVVDAKMKEIARSTGSDDTQKIAIMAALNIADDYIRVRGSAGADSGGTDERLARMVTLLDEVLAE